MFLLPRVATYCHGTAQIFNVLINKYAMVMDESIAINGRKLLLALAIPSECNLEFIIGGF